MPIPDERNPNKRNDDPAREPRDPDRGERNPDDRRDDQHDYGSKRNAPGYREPETEKARHQGGADTPGRRDNPTE